MEWWLEGEAGVPREEKALELPNIDQNCPRDSPASFSIPASTPHLEMGSKSTKPPTSHPQPPPAEFWGLLGVLGWFSTRNVEVLPGLRLAEDFISGMMPSSHSLVAEEHFQATCTFPFQVWMIQAAPGSAAPRDPWGCGCGRSRTSLGPVLTCTRDLGTWSCPAWTATTSKCSDSPQAGLSLLIAFFPSKTPKFHPKIPHPHVSDKIFLSL